jgi:Glycosyl transferase family 2
MITAEFSTNVPGNYNPKLSIIIVTHDRLSFLQNLLNTIVKYYNLFDFEFEVIFIFNGGKVDDFKNFAELNLHESYNFNIRSILINETALHTSRNLGFDLSKSENLFFLDDDVEITKNWINALNTLLVSNNFEVVGGPAIPVVPESTPSWFWSLFTKIENGWMNEWFSLIELETSITKVNHEYIFGQNILIKKYIYANSSGFHPDAQGVPISQYLLIGDGETGFLHELAKSYRIDFNKDLKVLHHLDSSRISLDYLAQRAFTNGIATSYFLFRNDLSIIKFYYFILLKRLLFITYLYLAIIPLRILGKKYLLGHYDLIIVWRVINKSYRSGFKSHNQGLKRDKEIRTYVLKKNYFNKY